MSYGQYIKDHLYYIFSHIFSLIFCILFLSSVNVDSGIINILIIVWLLISVLFLQLHYYFRRRYLEEINTSIDGLDQKYLIAELIEPPVRGDDRMYYSILKSSCKSMIEEISKTRRERKEYKEYIEQWIHDVKTPIAAIRLLCENNKSELTRKLMIELGKISHFTDQALFYARSDNVEKDYLIKEHLLSDIIHLSLAENKSLLIHHHVSVHVENCECTVFTDEKWICFMLNQLITNAVKYRSDSPSIFFESSCAHNKVILSVKDNGIGISKHDLPRIFDKGFTGENGRDNKYSTGIGMYLCKRLSLKLGIGIIADSEQNQGTTMQIIFPKNHFTEVSD